MRGFFVAGTDTGVGKTQVAGALLSLMVDAGHKPFAFKPYETGVVDEPEDATWLQKCAGGWQPMKTVCLHRFAKPVAPAVAGRSSWAKTLKVLQTFKDPGVVEAAGGLRVPLDNANEVIDLAEAVGLPVVLVARAGLGTLNHVALSLDLIERRELFVAAVVLVKSTRGVDVSEESNPKWLKRRHAVKVLGPCGFYAHRDRRHEALKKLLAPLMR